MLENALLISLFCPGLFAVSGEGKVLSFYRNWLDKSKWLGPIRKPMGTCVVCMSSFWGLLWLVTNHLALGHEISWRVAPGWVTSILAAAYLNYLGWSLLSLIDEHFVVLGIQRQVQSNLHRQLLNS